MDKDKDYSQFLIKEYTLWSVYVHENQGYLGRCYIWCKRTEARDLTDATVEEWHQLHYILKRMEATLNLAFGSTMLNYALLGNVTRHLYCHIIPRYEQPVVFAGMTFEDKRWGKNYLTNRNFVTPPHVLDEVIRIIKVLLQ